MKKTISLLLCVCVLLTLCVPALAADSKTVEQTIVALGIMSGDNSGNLNLGRTVTRAEFAKMLVSASVYKDTVQGGSGSSPFKDVKYTHWAADYIKTVVDAKWMTGYVDGTFRPDSTISYEEAASAILKLLGYTTEDLTGTYPQAQITKFKSLRLDSGVNPAQGRALTRNECMYIFCNLMGAANKSGAVYGTTLGYAMNSAGEVDYTELIKADVEGPYTVTGSNFPALLPFGAEQASVYRNGKPASPDQVARYDIVYYNVNTKTVWAYSSRVLGVYTEASPSAVSPDSITVAGKSYTLETSAAKSKAASTGEFSIGDTVALLLGMDGGVADIISAAAVNGSFYGVVTESALSTYSVGAKSRSDYIISVACTDGESRQCIVEGNHYSVGSVVTVTYTKGEISVKSPGTSNLSGKVSSGGTRLGDYSFADNVEIMDVSKDGRWTVIYPSRIAGTELKSGYIRNYVLNDKKEISHLILNDVTGDVHSYGVVTDVQETETTSSGMTSVSGTYKYLVGSTAGTLSSSSAIYNMSTSPAIFYYKDGKVSSIKNLKSAPISELSELSAVSGNQKYQIHENVLVYIRDSGFDYNLSEFSAVSTEEYSLTGHYDDIFPAGGQIRVIVATKK